MAPWFKYSTSGYKTVEDKVLDVEDDENTLSPKKRDGIALKFLLSFLGGLAFGVVLSMAFQSSTPPKKIPIASRHGYYATKVVDGELIEGTQCGDSWQEAKELGCFYDVIASRWYSPECFDKESLDNMMKEPGTDFTWYSDQEHTIEVSSEIARRGEFDVLYPLHNFHKIHCLYLWRKMHHSLLNNLPLDDDLMAEHHTIHCTQNILTWADPGVSESASIAHAGRPFCRHNPLGIVPLELV